MSELKACPFCGYSEISLQNNDKFVGYQCNGCGASPEWDLGESGARDKWNTRPIEDALQRKLDKAINLLRGTASDFRNFYVSDPEYIVEMVEEALKELEET